MSRKTKQTAGSDLRHKCCLCGHEWSSPDQGTADEIRKAVQVNHCGPYCGVCYHLEMADRYSRFQGHERVETALIAWRKAQARIIEQHAPK